MGSDAGAPNPVLDPYRKRFGRLLLRAVLPRSLLLLIEFMLTAYDRRGAQRSQARAGKARHHDQVARLRHITARGLGRRGRGGCSGHRLGVILLLDLVIDTAFTAVVGLLLIVLSLILALVLLLRFRLLALVLLLMAILIRVPAPMPTVLRMLPPMPAQSSPMPMLGRPRTRAALRPPRRLPPRPRPRPRVATCPRRAT